MSTLSPPRPDLAAAGHGGAPARRAVCRWAWRLFRREWRQQLLVLALLTVAVAGTTFGVAAAANAPSSPDATFGTASYLISLPGGPHLAADIAAARRWFGVIEVIGHQTVPIPGSLNTTDLRAQAPDGVYGHPMLRLDAGRYPAGPGQVAVTAGVAAIYRLRIGSTWRVSGHLRRVTGLVENPQDLQDNFALAAPGQASPPRALTILLRASAARADAFRLPGGGPPDIEARPPADSNFPASAVLVFAVVGLLFVGLVAVAGFTALAGRRLRLLGMLGAIGATGRHVRLVMISNGVIAGVTAAVAGAAAGLIAWAASVPRLDTITGHRIGELSLPWLDVGAAMLLAVLTATAAAWWPARTAARIPVVAALSGRPPRPQPGHRFAALGCLLLAAGLGLLAACHRGRSPVLTLTGVAATAAGMMLLCPLAIRALAAAGGRAPVAVRLALRDLARYQARSGAALAAASLTLGIAAAFAISAAQARAAAAIPPSGGNLPPDQLAVYLSAGEQPSGAVPSYSAAGLRARQARVTALAAILHARSTLELTAAVAPAAPFLSPAQGGPGQPATTLLRRVRVTVNGRAGVGYTNSGPGLLYVATGALLRQFGIRPAGISPAADILTSRPGLTGYLLTDFAGERLCPGGAASCRVHRSHPGTPPPTLPGIAHPVLERAAVLPRYTSDPGTVITMHAVRTLGLRLVPAGWLVQTPRPLTAAQVLTADHLAALAGLTVETRISQSQPDLSRLATEATAAGALVALGVLAMTIGLIRSETAGDLRILTAAGAGGGTRRGLAGTTAGALGLLGGLLGTAAAYLAITAWDHGVPPAGRLTPVADLGVIVIGLPLAAAAGGWLLAGREPRAIARRPLD